MNTITAANIYREMMSSMITNWLCSKRLKILRVHILTLFYMRLTFLHIENISVDDVEYYTSIARYREY